MSGSSHSSLTTVLHVHVLVIITVTDVFEVPTTTILELSRNIKPVPVFRHPTERRRSISSVHFKDIEAREESESACGHSFPESSPLNNSSVFINSFSLGEVKSWIRVHGRSLDERLELVTRVTGSSFNSENSLNRLFTHDRVTLAISNMGEFLIFRPLDLMSGTTIVIIMSSSRSVFQVFSIVDFLSLREPGSCWLSPSVVVLKELVIEVIINLFFRVSDLVESGKNIAEGIKAFRTDLSNVQVNHIAVVSVNIHEFIFS